MKQTTIDALLQINKTFYNVVEPEFNGTRQKPWEGWYKLLPYLWELPKASRILDLGCGNGRFGEFLLSHLEDAQYRGIDQNEGLVRTAKSKISKGTFAIADITLSETFKAVEEKQDIISLIAVLHHIPSFEKRQKLLEMCTKKLAQGGFLIFTAWQFLSIAQLKNRVIEWGNYDLIEKEDIEKEDYLIDWQRGQHAIRYCHLITAKEIELFIEPLQLKKVAQYFADGKDGQSNIYVVLQKSSR